MNLQEASYFLLPNFRQAQGRKQAIARSAIDLPRQLKLPSTSSLNHEFSRSVESLRAQGNISVSEPINDLDFKKQVVQHVFDDVLESSIKKLEELHPFIVRKMKNVVKAAIKNYRQNLPFRLLPDIPIDNPVNVTFQVNVQNHVNVDLSVVRDDVVPPVPEPIKEFNDSKVGWAVTLSGMRAGRCAVLESLWVNSDPFRNPVAAALAVGLASYQAGWSFRSPLGAGLVSTTLSTGIVLLQNFSVGRRLCLSQLKGYDLAVKLHEVGSGPYDARANLASCFGTRWVSDFETWSRMQTSIPLEKALSIAKEFRNQVEHAALLNSEIAALEKTQRTVVSGERSRHLEEKQKITKIAKAQGFKSLEDTEHAGIRCLTYFEDSALSKDAAELYKLLRSNRLFESRENVYARTTKYLTDKYPISMAYFSHPEIASESFDEKAVQRIGALCDSVRMSTQAAYTSTQRLYASLRIPEQLRRGQAVGRTYDIEMGPHHE